MQYTPGVAAVATATPPRPVATASCPTTRPAGPAATAPALPLTVATASLAAAFAAVPDPRRAQGTRFPLTAILTMAVAAILCNHLSVLAIAEWGPPKAPRCCARSASLRGVRPINRRCIACSASSIPTRYPEH